MELKQRKRIVNRYDSGKLGQTPINSSGIAVNGNDQFGFYQAKPLPDKFVSNYNNMLNTQNAGSKLNLGGDKLGGAIGGIGQTAMTMFNNYNAQKASVKDENQLLSSAGTSDNSVMGISYTQQNDIDGAQAMKEVNATGLSSTLGSTVSGATTGARIAGPWGAVAGGAIGLIGGLFGWGASKRKQRRRIWNAQQLADRTNQLNRSSAITEGLQQQYYQNNGDTTNGLLYANRGKDLKKPKYEY